HEEAPVGIQLARNSEPLHHLVGRNSVNIEPLQAVSVDRTLVDQLGDEADRPHLAHQRRVEADLIDAVENLHRGTRHLFTLERIDVDNNDVSARAVIDQREDRRIAHVTTVPVVLTVDLDSLEQEGQAARSKNVPRIDLASLEDLDLAGAHVRCREEELDRAIALTQCRKIDALIEQILEWIATKQVELIGREQPG